MNYLDRTNIGNAKVAGLQTDLGLDDNGYSLALLIFFVVRIYFLYQIVMAKTLALLSRATC